MKRQTSRWVAVLILGLLGAALPLASFGRCGGTERWPVKVGTDDSASEVNVSSIAQITLAEINAIPDPRGQIKKNDDDTRLDVEKRVYQVKGILRLFKNESDQDYHLVITDSSLKYSKGGTSSKGKETGTSFIAEIADPKCYMGAKGSPAKKSRWAEQLREARDQFELRFPGGEGDDKLMNVPVTLVGLAFFDRDHGQVGRAKNGFEIHPVLSISFDDDTAPLALPSALGAPTNLIVNSGFEDGDAGWKASPGVIDADGYPDPARGNAKAVLGNLGRKGQMFLYQQVRIPKQPTLATLTYRLRVRTGEPTSKTTTVDTMRVQIRDASGNWIKTVKTYSNLDRSRSYKREQVDLTAYRGRTIRVHFISDENATNATSFLIDDVELQVR